MPDIYCRIGRLQASVIGDRPESGETERQQSNQLITDPAHPITPLDEARMQPCRTEQDMRRRCMAGARSWCDMPDGSLQPREL